MYPNQTSLLAGPPRLSVVMASLKRTLAVERMEHVASKMKNTRHSHSFSEDHSVQLSKKKLASDQISLIAAEPWPKDYSKPHV